MVPAGTSTWIIVHDEYYPFTTTHLIYVLRFNMSFCAQARRKQPMEWQSEEIPLITLIFTTTIH